MTVAVHGLPKKVIAVSPSDGKKHQMNAQTKAVLKIAWGFASGANAVASAFGYGLVGCMTRNHHVTSMGSRLAAMSFQRAEKTIRDGLAEFEYAKRRS